MNPGDLERLEAVGVESAFVIVDGTVVVEAPDEGAVEFGPGSLIGERALLSPAGVRAARVRALSNVRVLAVERSAFEHLCAEDPTLADRLRP